jgi:hypothetical protein
MSEIQSSTQQGSQLSQRFIEFVMLQGQQAAFSMGLIPHPATGETAINLEAARIFIDHLELLHEKTKGNLSQDEETILNRILSQLQLDFVQVSGSANKPAETTTSHKGSSSDASATQESDSDEDQKKKFSKSYGES